MTSIRRITIALSVVTIAVLVLLFAATPIAVSNMQAHAFPFGSFSHGNDNTQGNDNSGGNEDENGN